MDKVEEQLNNLSSVEMPKEIHKSFMHGVKFYRFRAVFFIALALLVVGFLFTVWIINAKLIDAEFLDMMQDFLEVFSFSFSFVKTMVENFFEIIHPMLLFFSIISLIGLVYLIKKIKNKILHFMRV